MWLALCSLLACFFASYEAAQLDYPEYGGGGDGLFGDFGDLVGAGGGCPMGARCMPVDLCPAAAQWGLPGAVRSNRCGTALPGAQVCCWSVAALGLRPPFARGRSVRSPTAARTASSPAPIAMQQMVPLLRASQFAAMEAGPAFPPAAGMRTGRTLPSVLACQKYVNFSMRNRKRRADVQYYPVIGGARAVTAEFPYMVAIGYVRERNNPNTTALSWGCGGNLISDRYVLTAAHCVTDAQSQNMRPVVLRTGVNHLAEGPRLADDYAVEQITVHPRHRKNLKYFDLALLRTDRPVAFTQAEFPVCLPQASTRIDLNTNLLVAGWGTVDPKGYEMSADLKRAELRLVELGECKNLIKEEKELPHGVDESMICAGDPSRKADTCKGDSGGPLVMKGPAGDVLLGVTSFGSRPCAGPNPGVYAAVYPHLSWIESVVWPTSSP